MELSKLIIYAVIFIVVLVLVLFPEARTLLKGFTRIFIKDMATTPEGAEAVYSEKIDQAREAYRIADDGYKKAEGKLVTSKRELESLRQRLTKVEKDCESLVKADKIDSAQLKAEEREEILYDIKRYEQLVRAFTEASKQAKEAQEVCEKNLRKLQRESREVVENMKGNTIVKECIKV